MDAGQRHGGRAAADRRHQYRIGSLTKTFVAVLVMRLRDEGRLELGDPLEKHLAGTAAGRLTIAELLSHTSGLAAETPGPLWYWGPSAFALRLREGRVLELSSASGKGRSARFRPQTDGTWTGLDGYYAGEVLRPVRGAGGAVSHLDVGSFVFTREPYDASAAVPGGVDPEGWRARSRP